jgi:hypothetical protein
MQDQGEGEKGEGGDRLIKRNWKHLQHWEHMQHHKKHQM